MKRKGGLPELLAPAGDMESLYAAVEGGADAVYVGAKQYGARAYAKNFEIEELAAALSYCHLHGVRLYVTLNTLLYTREVTAAVELAAELYRIGVDALIVCDLGLIKKIRESANPIELHASTQMSLHNSLGADEAYRLGCSRVVLARELSLENIRETTEKCLPEVEVFLHGALCVCHSGQCLFSSVVGGRSGNRGECAQPCRLPYKEGYALSLRDLSLASHIPALIESGVASLKIEGRMKSPTYVYTVTSIYRRLLDEGRAATEEENERLLAAFSRSGFTDGYFTSHTEKMTGIRTERDKALSGTLPEREFLPKRLPTVARVEVKIGESAVFELTLPSLSRTVRVTGAVAECARSAPLSAEELRARLSKMGATHFTLSPSDIEVELDEGANLAPSAINALRREAAQRLSDFTRPHLTLKETAPPRRIETERKNTALFLREELYFGLLGTGALDKFDIIFLPTAAIERAAGDGRLGVYIPPVVTECELPSVRESLRSAARLGVKYALVGNVGAISLAASSGLLPVGDFRLGATNSYSVEALSALGVSDTLASVELGTAALARVGGGAVVYGRIPLMLTERCFIRENFGCKNCESAALTDRLGEKFPIIKEAGHRNLILNSRPTYMGDKMNEEGLSSLGIRHFIFSTESVGEAREVISDFFLGRARQGIRRIGKR